MIELSELKVVENAFLRRNTEYDKPSFYPFIERNFSENKLFNETTKQKFTGLLATTNDHLAHNVVLHKDLTAIQKSISKKDLVFDEKAWIKKMPLVRQKIERELGLRFTPKEISFCDSFPASSKNLEQRGASAITVFEGSEGAGIYFLKRRVDMTSTAIHLIHEQIHTCFSQNKDKEQIFMEWFEEGLAILYSLKIYYEVTSDMKTLQAYRSRSWIYSRVKPEWDFTKRYFEYMKIISRIFLAGGFKLLTQLQQLYLSKQREKINTYLEKIEDGSLKITYIPKNDFEQFIANYGVVIEPEQITPLEYRIVTTLKKPQTIEEISTAICAPLDVTKNALNHLFGKGVCLVVKENKIDINWRKQDLFEKGLLKPIFPMN